MKRKSNSGFTLIEILIALVIGLFLIFALYLIAGKGNLFYNLASSQNRLQKVGWNILDDITQEVRNADRISAIATNSLTLMNRNSQTIAYTTSAYPEGGTGNNRMEKRIDGVLDNTFHPDPSGVVRVENVIFQYFDGNDQVTDDPNAVRNIGIFLTLSSRTPDPTGQRLQLDTKVSIRRQSTGGLPGLITGTVTGPDYAVVEAKDVVSSPNIIVGSVFVAGGSTYGLYVPPTPTTGTIITYTLECRPITNSPAATTIYAPDTTTHTGITIGPGQPLTGRNFSLVSSSADFGVTGSFETSQYTTASVYDNGTVLGTGTPYLIGGNSGSETIAPVAGQNYPRTFHLWGTLANVNATSLTIGDSYTLSITSAIDGAQTDTQTAVDDGFGNGIATFAGSLNGMRFYSHTIDSNFRAEITFFDSSPTLIRATCSNDQQNDKRYAIVGVPITAGTSPFRVGFPLLTTSNYTTALRTHSATITNNTTSTSQNFTIQIYPGTNNNSGTYDWVSNTYTPTPP